MEFEILRSFSNNLTIALYNDWTLLETEKQK